MRQTDRMRTDIGLCVRIFFDIIVLRLYIFVHVI